MSCPPGLQTKKIYSRFVRGCHNVINFFTEGDIINTIKYPKINIANFLQRANDLVYIWLQDKTELIAAGLLWEKVEKLIYLFQN